MKKEIKITLIILGVFLFIVGIIGGIVVGLNKKNGNISKVNVVEVSSNIYSKDEINNAIKVAKGYFRDNFTGCTLNEIKYIGDEKNRDYQDWASRNNKEEVIVLISTFKTGSKTDGSLNTNDTYKNWNWILVRNKDENWQHADHGY